MRRIVCPSLGWPQHEHLGGAPRAIDVHQRAADYKDVIRVRTFRVAALAITAESRTCITDKTGAVLRQRSFRIHRNELEGIPGPVPRGKGNSAGWCSDWQS